MLTVVMVGGRKSDFFFPSLYFCSYFVCLFLQLSALFESSEEKRYFNF